MRYIDPETLDPYFDGRPGYGDYIRDVWDRLPAGVVSLVEAVFHDGWLTLIEEPPASATLRFNLSNYVGDGWVVYDIRYSGVTAVERIEPWPGPVQSADPPFRRWFATQEGDGVRIHRDEVHVGADGLFEHRLLTGGGAVCIIHFRDVSISQRPE